MTTCERVWLALTIGWQVIVYVGAGLGIFFAGYQQGRRVEAEQWDDAPEPGEAP